MSSCNEGMYVWCLACLLTRGKGFRHGGLVHTRVVARIVLAVQSEWSQGRAAFCVCLSDLGGAACCGQARPERGSLSDNGSALLLSFPLDRAAVCIPHFATFALSGRVSPAYAQQNPISSTLSLDEASSVVMQQYPHLCSLSGVGSSTCRNCSTLLVLHSFWWRSPVCAPCHSRGGAGGRRCPGGGALYMHYGTLLFLLEWLGMHDSSPAGRPEHLARTPTLYPSKGNQWQSLVSLVL